MQQFHAWDQVKAIAGEFDGKAGVVQHFDKETGLTTVKFDELDAPNIVESDELKRLG